MPKTIAFLTAAAATLVACSQSNAATPPSGAPPAAPIYREIRDWIIACDNTRACVAKFIPDEMTSPAEDPIIHVSISRGGGPAGDLTVELTSEQSFEPAAARLDGRPIGAGRPWRRGTGKDRALAASLQGDAALAFVRDIRNGGRLTFSNAAAKSGASLSGLAAVLLAMDDDQGRIGNVGALMRPGPAPASAIPAAPGPPVVYAAPMATPLTDAPRLIAAVRRLQGPALKRHECEPKASLTEDDDAEPLNGTEALVLLACGSGPYQSWSLAFRVPRDAPGQARLLVLPTPPTLDAKPDPSLDGEYTEGTFDPKTATFSEAAKGRGLADCGFSTAWTFDGRDFHLSSFARQERCGGDPGDWPTLYRTRAQPAR